VTVTLDLKNRLVDIDAMEDNMSSNQGQVDRSELEITRIKNTHKTLEAKIQTLQAEIDKLEMKQSQSRHFGSS
jgi:chromosome segregation ATPase